VTFPGPDLEDEPEHLERLAVERARLQSDAVGGSFWISVQTILGLPLAAAANAVVAHRLGAGAYGKLAVYMLVYAVVVAIVNLGVSEATVQWIATHNARRERHLLVETIRRCSGYHLFIEAPIVGIVSAALVQRAGPIAMVVSGSSAAFVMAVGTSSVVMSGAGLNALAARISLVATVAGQTAIIGVAGGSPLASSVFIGRVAVGLIGPLLALLRIPGPMRAALLRPKLPRRWPDGFVPFALRTCGAGVVSTLVFGRSELLAFDSYGKIHDAGVFALAAGVAGLITAPIDSLLNPLLPAATSLLVTEPRRAGQALLRGLRTSTLLAGLIVVSIPTVAPLLPVVYGGSFATATRAFVALAVVSCIQSVNHPVTAFLLAGRRTDLLLKTGLLSVAIDAGLAFALIPSIGVAGAVVASSAAQLLVLFVVSYRVGQMVGVTIWQQLRAVSYFVDALIILAAVVLVQFTVRGLPHWEISVIGFAAALLGIAVLGRLRPATGLEPADVEVIRQGLPRPFRSLFVRLIGVFSLQVRR
jgi:O-antigen/teichoic acid export membrane protein